MARAIPVIELVLGICADLAFLLQGFERAWWSSWICGNESGLCLWFVRGLSCVPCLFRYLVSETSLNIVTGALGVDEWGINRLLVS